MIDPLAEHAQFAPTLARWHHDEWSHLNPARPLEDRLAELAGESGAGTIPLTVVAHRAGVPLGSASLIANDMDTRMDLTPWLASVYVAPPHRRQGIASALVRRIEREAAAQGVRTLYLFTPDQERLYARLGWTVLERTTYLGHAVVVMSRSLARGSAEGRFGGRP